MLHLLLALVDVLARIVHLVVYRLRLRKDLLLLLFLKLDLYLGVLLQVKSRFNHALLYGQLQLLL